MTEMIEPKNAAFSPASDSCSSTSTSLATMSPLVSTLASTSTNVEGIKPERSATPSNLVLLVTLRSEEHTSELQSRPHLVCRLLLEKKKIDGSDSVRFLERSVS